MYIQLNTLRNLFPEIQSTYNISEKAYNLTGFSLIRPGCLPPRFSLHTLYVIDDPRTAKEVTPPENALFMFLLDNIEEEIVFNNCPLENLSVIRLHTRDSELVFRTLQDYFDDVLARGCFADSMLEILFSEGGIQYMLDKTKPAFHNPIFVFDTDFRLLATTWDSESDDEHGRNIIEAGGFTQAEYDVMNKNHTHHKVMNSEYPVKVTHPTLGFEQLLCAIDTKKDMGHIVLNGTNRPLVEEDQKLLYILKEAIDQQMKKDEFIRNNKGFNYEYFLRDILDGKMTIGMRNADRMNYVKQTFYGNMYCMVIESARSLNTINISHIRSVIDTSFTTAVSIMYNGGVIVIFSYQPAIFMPEKDLSMIKELCRTYGIFAGMGNCFNNILEIKEYYTQALRSIELGVVHHPEPDLFLYKDNYLNHISSVFRQKESFDAFCSTKLKILLDKDKRDNTSYADTLYTYLVCERNIAATANALFMHRNTLVYRLKKIAELVDINYDDFSERQHIILSYEMKDE